MSEASLLCNAGEQCLISGADSMSAHVQLRFSKGRVLNCQQLMASLLNHAGKTDDMQAAMVGTSNPAFVRLHAAWIVAS